jgi:hypothetical protein
MDNLDELTEAAAACGLKLEQTHEPERTECWPANALPMQVLLAVPTQWRVTQSGHTLGLHYEALPGVLDMMAVPRAEREDTFWALRQMEAALVPWFNRKN